MNLEKPSSEPSHTCRGFHHSTEQHCIEWYFPPHPSPVNLWTTLWIRGPRGLQLSGLLWISPRTARERPTRVSTDTDTTRSSTYCPQTDPWLEVDHKRSLDGSPQPSACAHLLRRAVGRGFSLAGQTDRCLLLIEAPCRVVERQASAAALPSVPVECAAPSPLDPATSRSLRSPLFTS